MANTFDLKIESEVVRLLINPVSRKEILQTAIRALEQTLSARLANYQAVKMQIAVDELLCELVGEGLLSTDKIDELQKEAREGERWLEK